MNNRNEMTKKDWNAKANEFNQSSSDASQRARDSFDRCDTDGYLSQWAQGETSQLDRAKEDLCRNEGLHSFVGLYLNDRRIKAKEILVTDQFTGNKKSVWLLHDDEKVNVCGKKFLPHNNGGGRSRILNAFGLKELDVESPAWCTLKGHNDASYSLFVLYFRVDNEWGENDKLIKAQ